MNIEKLGDITTCLDSRRVPLNDSERGKIRGLGKYPYIGANNILDYIDQYIFDQKILCIAEDGGNWAFNQDCALIVDEKCWVNNHAHVLVENGKSILEYLKYYLNYANLNSYITGTTRGKLTRSALNRIPIPLPSLPIQKKIADALDKADAIRKRNQQILQKYDQLAQSVFLEMFGDPIINPKRWETKTITEICSKNKFSLKRGPFGGALKKEIFVEEGYLVYEQYHALNNDFTWARYFINENKFQELKSFECKPGDIIISCSGVNLGRLAIVPKNARPGIINQALLKINLDQNKMKNEFFIRVFSNDNFKNTFYGFQRGAGIPNFPPMETFKSFQFICPPLGLQLKFNEIIDKIYLQKKQILIEFEKSNNLFQSILQRAFKGELFPEIENEPIL